MSTVYYPHEPYDGFWIARPGVTLLVMETGIVGEISMTPSEQAEFLRGLTEVPEGCIPDWVRRIHAVAGG